jgi:hypothetical protein
MKGRLILGLEWPTKKERFRFGSLHSLARFFADY